VKGLGKGRKAEKKKVRKDEKKMWNCLDRKKPHAIVCSESLPKAVGGAHSVEVIL